MSAELEIPGDDMPRMIGFLSSVLERVAESNDGLRWSEAQKASIFHGLARPAISIRCYMERIFKYAKCSPSCFVVAYIYLDRFVHKQPALPLNSFNVHRLLIASVLVSAKFMDDMLVLSIFHFLFFIFSRLKLKHSALVKMGLEGCAHVKSTQNANKY